MAENPFIRATVTDYGDGLIEFVVDRDTLEYPAIGTRVEIWPVTEPERPMLRLVKGTET